MTDSLVVTPDWLDCHHRLPASRLRLYCLPFAGGSSTFYRSWGTHLAPDVETVTIELPGRGRLTRLPPARHLHTVADSLTPVLAADREPIALFGYSLGAVLAFEVARRLEAMGRGVAHLFVCSRAAPHIRSPERPFSRLDRESLIQVLREYGATPEDILNDAALMDHVVPVVRADFAMSESYVPSPGPPLECPVTVFGGDGDPWVSAGQLDGWKRHTSGPCATHLYPGGHFFIDHCRDEVLGTVRTALAGGREGAAP
ncbi:thioesterase II family protein [Streptomyces sp. NPDC001985]|uniref:thioesterase II family protein n=1 Tax=Streptomyces sp. NPDC001985 TaxID=3154406 RepID=UPI00332B59EA